MHRIIENLCTHTLAILFPEPCLICGNGSIPVCAPCVSTVHEHIIRLPDHMFALSSYKIPGVRNSIARMKYSDARFFERAYAHLLSVFIHMHARPDILSSSAITHIPSVSHHENHLTRTVARAARMLGISHLHTLANTSTSKQTNQPTRTARINNSGISFVAGDQLPQHITTLYVIDDVLTTGHTLSTAISALKEAYPSLTIIGIALAH